MHSTFSSGACYWQSSPWPGSGNQSAIGRLKFRMWFWCYLAVFLICEVKWITNINPVLQEAFSLLTFFWSYASNLFLSRALIFLYLSQSLGFHLGIYCYMSPWWWDLKRFNYLETREREKSGYMMVIFHWFTSIGHPAYPLSNGAYVNIWKEWVEDQWLLLNKSLAWFSHWYPWKTLKKGWAHQLRPERNNKSQAIHAALKQCHPK